MGQSVNIKRQDVIEALQKSLEIHRAEYAEALEDYREACLKFFEEGLEALKSGVLDESKLQLKVSMPDNYEHEFTSVLDMLEYSVDEVINLDSDTFAAYFKNKWYWKNNFNAALAATKLYLGK